MKCNARASCNLCLYLFALGLTKFQRGMQQPRDSILLQTASSICVRHIDFIVASREPRNGWYKFFGRSDIAKDFHILTVLLMGEEFACRERNQYGKVIPFPWTHVVLLGKGLYRYSVRVKSAVSALITRTTCYEMNTRGARIARILLGSVKHHSEGNNVLGANDLAELGCKFRVIFMRMTESIRLVRDMDGERSTFTTEQQMWLLCEAMCAGVKILRFMKRMMQTRSNKALATRALELIRSGAICCCEEGDMPSNAHVEFMGRLLRLQYKSFRARSDITCAYTMRDVFICSRARRDYSFVRRTYETDDQMEIIRDLDERCMKEACIVEEALLYATVELAGGAPWVSVRSKFSEKFLLHGDNFCTLNNELGTRMHEFREQALGEMWELVAKDEELGKTRLPSDPVRMEVLGKMEQFCASKDYSDRRSNMEIAADLVMESQPICECDKEDVDEMRKRCIARACSMLDPSLFDKAFFDGMRNDIGTLAPRSTVTHLKVIQAAAFVYANAESWCIANLPNRDILMKVGESIGGGFMSMYDMRRIVHSTYHAVDGVQMLECGALEGLERQYWETASQVRVRMIEKLSRPRTWAEFNPVFVQCLSNAFGQLMAAMLVLRDRHCPCLCAPAVLFLRTCLEHDQCMMEEEEQVLRQAIGRLHIGSEDLNVMYANGGHEWVHWSAVSHMVVELIRRGGDVPRTMKPFEKRLKKLSSEFGKYSRAAACVEVGMRCADPSMVSGMRSEDFMSLAAAGDSKELRRVCRGMDLGDAMNLEVIQRAEDGLGMAWARQQSTEVQSLYGGGVSTRYGESLLKDVFALLVPTRYPLLPSGMTKEAMACGREVRCIAKAVYLISRHNYSEMVEYVLACVKNELD